MLHPKDKGKKFTILMAFVFLLLTESLALAENIPSAIEWVSKCIRLANDGRYQEAIEACSTAIA